MDKLVNRIRNKEFLMSSLFVLIGISITKIFLLSLNFFLASVLSSNDFGIFSLIRSSSSTFVSIFWYPLNIAIIAQISSYRKDKLKIEKLLIFIFRLLITLFICSVILSVIFSDFLIENLYENNITVLEYYLILGLFITSLLTSVFIGVCVGLEKTKWIVNVSFKSLTVVLIIVILSLRYSYNGAIIGLMIYYLTQLFFYLRKIAALFNLRIYSKIYIHELKREFFDFNKIGVPLLMITIITNLTYFLLKVYVFNVLSPSSLALYELADQWNVMISTILSAIVMPIIPKLIKEGFSKKFKTRYILVLLLITIVFLIFGYISSLYIESVFIDKFKGLNELVVYLLIATIPYSIFLFLDKILIAKNLPWRSFLGYLGLMLTMILVVFLNKFSMLIVAKSILISNIIGMLILFFLDRNLKVKLWG